MSENANVLDSSEVAARLGELTRCAMEIAMGNLEQPIEVPEAEDAFTEITTALELMRQDLLAQVEELNERIYKEQTIAAQAATIRELSTPVIQIWDEILILPLIGTVDTARARQIVESLLDAVVRHQASMVIMDVTGVPVVDTQVANHFLKTVQAARLLGAEVILTGISPESAQTIARLGLDLSSITTRSSLRSGLQLAFQRTGGAVDGRSE